MKANEAPEKIYISHHTVSDSMGEPVEEFWEDWSEEKEVETDIEYTRTDAFIEKACEFLKSYRQDIYDGMGYIAGIVNDKTIEDFRNYMKGE